MTGRASAGLALTGCGVLLLAATQPWLATVTEVAPGAPRVSGAVGGAELVAWLAPVALVTALALVAGLTGMRWARPLAGVASLVLLAGAARAAAVATSAEVPGSPAVVVSAAPTGWLWVAAAAALVTTVCTVLWWRPWSLGAGSGHPGPAAPSGGGGSRAGRSPHDRSPADRASDDPHGAEAERRQTASDWRDLSEGRDPTGP